MCRGTGKNSGAGHPTAIHPHAAAARLAAGDRNYERFFRIRILPAPNAGFPAGAADARRQHRRADRGAEIAVVA